MTYGEILNRFKNKFPSATVNDFRPTYLKEFTDGKKGITIWLDNGDVVIYYPQEETAENVEDITNLEVELKCLKGNTRLLEKDIERLWINSNWIIEKLREKGIVTLKDIAGKE